MSDLESRHLGPITLDGGIGGGSMTGAVPFAGESLPVRIEIDFPQRLNESIVNDIDMVLDHLEFTDGMARDTIATGLSRDGSAAAEMFRVWEQRPTSREGGQAEFVRALRPTQLTILPDGGSASAERVVLTYGLADATGTLKVRFLEPTGPELAPAI